MANILHHITSTVQFSLDHDFILLCNCNRPSPFLFYITLVSQYSGTTTFQCMTTFQISSEANFFEILIKNEIKIRNFFEKILKMINLSAIFKGVRSRISSVRANSTPVAETADQVKPRS
jgi:hypothetical protein